MAAGIELAEPGLYHIVATQRWQNNTSGARHLMVSVERGGVEIKERRVVQGPAEAGQARQQVNLVHIAEPGDRVVVRVRQTSGAGLDVIAGGFTVVDFYRPLQ